MNGKIVPHRKELPQGYASWWNQIAGHLGGIYPFQDIASGLCSLDIAVIIEARRKRGDPVKLDTAALVAKAMLPYLLGNRTLLTGVRRAPWMSSVDVNGQWYPKQLPPHGMQQPDPHKFVHDLKLALIDEARTYIGSAGTVGILLSGGMDSRVLSGVVRALQQESDGAFAVIGLTWGSEASRDVVYARRITERFGWGWQHYPITARTLADNITYMGNMGAEVSPLHLHAIPQVAHTDGLDVVLAGSYGDSVGRAEFSGRRVTQLKPILPKFLDRFGVIRTKALVTAKPWLHADAGDTPHLDDLTPTLRRREIEQEMHYMRRMLQTCMLSIAKDRRFYQLFTAPGVFQKMWALDPLRRNDEWYIHLLSLLPGNLLEIPWARTGRRYDQQDDKPDQYLRRYHSYGVWLRGELRESVLLRINSERIRALGIFNDSGLDFALNAWQHAHTKTTNSLDELVSWVASLHDFIDAYEVQANIPVTSSSALLDKAKALRGGVHARFYVEARERVRI